MDANRTAGAGLGDDELVRQARDGHPEAFEILIERYQRRATSVSHRLLGNLHDALEVCQDAFVRAYRNLEKLDDERRFGPWLLKIVTNLSLNFRRDRAVGGRRVSLDDVRLDENGASPMQLADAEHSSERPGAELAAEELRQAVHAALEELPPQQRSALVLFSMEELPQKEVAEILDCSVEAVKWHVFQARRKLRERLADFL